MSVIDSVMRAFGYVRADQQTAEGAPVESREIGYRHRERLYDNEIYRSRIRGGSLENILKYDLNTTACNAKTAQLFLGYQNPVREIVDCYAGLFPGTWGDGMSLATKTSGKDVNPRLLADDPIGKLWRWSSLDTKKQSLLTWGPNLGTVGLRIYGKDDADPLNRRVVIQVDHPQKIVDFKRDDRGNVTDILLRYEILDPNRKLDDVGTADFIEVEEILSKDGFSRTHDGAEQLKDDQRRNELGVCPYVILAHHLPHRDGESGFGEWAYLGSEPVIHALNFLFWILADTTRANAKPNWFATGGGDAPVSFEVEGATVKYVKTYPDTPAPSLNALVADVKYEGVLAVLERMDRKLRERQPEMNFNSIELFSNLSGEALERAEQPTRKRLEDVRPNYDHAVKRALQIGLSYMIGLDLLDLGSGTRTADAANTAYQTGLMDFDFAPRPVLPLTTAQRLAQIQIEQAPTQVKLDTANKAAKLPVSDAEQLRLAGYDKKQIADILEQRAQQDVIPTEAM